MKIRHLSTVSKNPERAAKILAEMTGGRPETFTARGMTGAWVCMWGSDTDELVEFLPEGYLMCPSETGAVFKKVDVPMGYNSTHIQLEIQVPIDRIRQIADRHGCHHYFRPRSGGPLYEVWIEEQLLVELVSDEIRRMQ